MTHARPGRELGAVEPRTVPQPRGRHTSFARLVGAIGLLLLTALLFWMLTDDAFRVTDASVSFNGMAHAQEADVRDKITDLERGPNVFRVRASDIVSELSTLTEVDAAYARVSLPAGVTIELDEREPVFVWSNGALSWLVDEDGMLFAPADKATAEAVSAEQAAANGEVSTPEDDAGTTDAIESEAAALTEPDDALVARAALPVVVDARLRAEKPTVGDFLRASDLAVMRQLLALTPELLGSKAQQLQLRVDNVDGYVLKSVDRSWRALFGHYYPTLQPPEVIPRQVQCLQWLLANEEKKLADVRLALSDQACGTFTKHD